MNLTPNEPISSLGDTLLFKQYTGQLESNNLLGSITTDLKTVTFLMAQEGLLLKNAYHSNEITNSLITGLSASRLSRLLSYYYILTQSLVLLDRKRVIEETNKPIIAESLQSNRSTFKKYCFYCKAAVLFTLCDSCSKGTCITCAIADKNQVVHKKCYSKIDNKGIK